MSETGKRLRASAQAQKRLAEIADALEPVFGEVTFSPLADWVIPATCEMCGCPLEGGHCYCCKPVWGWGEGRAEVLHPNGISQKEAGTRGHPPIPLDEYVRAAAAAVLNETEQG